MTNQHERRRAKRRRILNTFFLFIVIPKKGTHRLEISDVSDSGILFSLDLEGEAPADFPLKTGEVLDLRLYLNHSLYLPLSVKVLRIEEQNQMRKVAGEFVDSGSKGNKGFSAFLQMLDEAVDIAKLDAATS